uniref:Uncharacterized protein n=1 Tax=Haptolina brevifila TaxID=156173 RepID=A0A7S2DTD8_9EUKA
MTRVLRPLLLLCAVLPQADSLTAAALPRQRLSVCHGCVSNPLNVRAARVTSRPPLPSRSGTVTMFGPGGSGGFFNMGAPEVVIIGAVAWVLLGPKELFRLSREAGQFLGQWQQLGQQAKDSFTSALEAEIADDQTKAATGTTAPPSPEPFNFPPSSPPAAASAESGVDSLPPLSEFTAARAASAASAERTAGTFTPDEEAAMRESLYGELGEPTASAANFQEQISGARNANVLAEYPAELEAPDEPGSALDVQSAEEDLLATQIDQAENELATLRTEKQLLSLKRQQLQANAERAKLQMEQRLEEERAVSTESSPAQQQVEP